MAVVFGIRREDKNKWERRVPLIPSDVATLQSEHGLSFFIQPSPIRCIPDDAWRDAGVELREDLASADLVVAVKEIPIDLLRAGQAYLCFSHTVKAQDYNMPNLRRMGELGCTLIDYEKIADDAGRRLIFFSLHAGYAGMIESLWALGRRLEAEGVVTPLAKIRHAWEYGGLEVAEREIRALGDEIARDGLPGAPLVIGVAGYGNVSRGAQAVLEWLPVDRLEVADLPRAAAVASSPLAAVVFREEHMVRPRDAGADFDLQEYYARPELYEGVFADHLPHLDLLVNTIYWEARYPRLVTNAWARAAFADGARPRLRAIGDISCDFEGSIEMTVKATEPDASCYVYDPRDGSVTDGVAGEGLVLMTVDNLPCELPLESSQHFSNVLRDMMPPLAAADWSADFAELDLPAHLKRAVIMHRGALTPPYAYLQPHIAG